MGRLPRPTGDDLIYHAINREGQFGVGQFGVSSSLLLPLHHMGQFGVSSSLLLPLHQVGKLDSWEDFQDRQAMTLFTTRSTAGTTEPMSSAPRANGICSLAISPAPRPDLWPQLFSDVSCIALWISSEKILTRLYSVLHWFHKRLEANVKKPRENRCFQIVIAFSFSSFDDSNKCTVLLKIAARLITVSTSVNKEMWVKLSTKARYPFALFGYCLMSNHFHLLLKPAPRQSISRILQSLTVAHTWRHHRRQGTSGHVWQGRFRSPVIQDCDHLLVVLRYIEANPVRAAMVADPCESAWTSHRCHGAKHADPILDSFPEWEQLGRTEPERRARWRRKVRGEQPAKELDGVRSSVRSGRPYGARDWVEVISHRLGIVREPRRRGRPPREKML